MTTAAQLAERLGLAESGDAFIGNCPCCGYERAFSVVYRNEKTLFHCHAGCTQEEVIQALRGWEDWGSPTHQGVETPPDLPVVPSPPREQSSSLEAAQAMWHRSQPARGTIVQTYLHTRGYLGPIPSALRYVTGKHPSDGQFHPLMLAAAVLAGDPPKFAGIHRTFLREDGLGKAPLNPDKMTLGAIRGAGVPLAPPGPKLAVSEGIETGLSVQQATGIPAWAAVSAGGMQALVLPAGVREVIIAADADEVGMKAAQAAARRWHDEGRTVRIAKPPEGHDFNDLAGKAP
jgi:putative DNA primase/helicase